MVQLSETINYAAKRVPIGAVVPHGSGTVPSGYLACDGAAVSRTTYASLFSVISTIYGPGDGSATFNLPDLRGIFPRGVGSQTISGTPYDGSTLGTKVKDRTNNSGLSASTSSTNSASVGASADQSHSHTWTDRFYNDPQATPTLSYSVPGPTGISLVLSYTNVETARTTNNPNVSLNHSHTVATNTVSSSSSLVGEDVNTTPGYLTAAYMIKV